MITLSRKIYGIRGRGGNNRFNSNSNAIDVGVSYSIIENGSNVAEVHRPGWVSVRERERETHATCDSRRCYGSFYPFRDSMSVGVIWHMIGFSLALYCCYLCHK